MRTLPGNWKFIAIPLLFFAQATLAQGDLDQKLLLASPDAIQADAALTSRMQALATGAINDHCAACHGADLTGQLGVPNLVDFDWNWGPTGYEMTQAEGVFKIMQTVLYGVRNQDCDDSIKRYGACPDTRFSQMPAYKDLEMTDQQINDLVDWVYSKAGMDHDMTAVGRATKDAGLCTECHAEDSMGYKDFGGPNLTDDVWLFGSSRDQVFDVIAHGRTGQCPAWAATLDAVTIKALSVYIYQKYMGY